MEWWYRRAEYNEAEQTYPVLHDDATRVTYSVVTLDDEDMGPVLALQKAWEDEGQYFELYPFRQLTSPDERDAVAAGMIARAKDTAPDENVVEFLCLIDIAKRWAINADLDDEDIEYIEGLFQMGPRDAYTQRPYSPERLHHHVQRPDDECWRIDVVRAAAADDPTRELGWIVYVMYYPELVSASTDEDIQRATYARLLDLEHHIDELGARVAVPHLEKFMTEGARVQDPEYAYLNDTLMFEFMSVLSRDENDHEPTWQVLPSDELQAFRADPILRRGSGAWFPRDLFRELTDAAKLSPGHVDQLAAMWHDLYGVPPQPFKKDSPFDDMDL